MKFFYTIYVFDVCRNCCYRLLKLIFASKYQNECDAALLLPLALFFDDVKAKFFMLFVKVHRQYHVRNYICRME